MGKLQAFVADLQFYLTTNKREDCNIIRKHSKKLEHLGDVSFPINIKNWHLLLKDSSLSKDAITIFDCRNNCISLNKQCNELKETSKDWSLTIHTITVVSSNAHIFLQRSSDLFVNVLQDVLCNSRQYGSSKCINKNYKFRTSNKIKDVALLDLTHLRLEILKDTGNIFLKKFSINNTESPELQIDISSNKSSLGANVLCSPVLNEKGFKSSTTTEELHKKRTLDMRMMAQHKYGIQINKIQSWEKYFDKLGKACIIIEMLSNKAQKPIKITLNNLQTANKGASFIFYNCARIATLLKEYDKRVENNIYPVLPELAKVDFSSVSQPEEWELFYVYILQYPLLTESCIKDIEKGLLNPHYLVVFLSNLCSVFSAYYRRIRILTVKLHKF